MSAYPTCRCLSPKRIFNPYTKESMVVPCGHCRACTLNRNNVLTTWCDMESSASKYTMFITLTYANRYIPRAKVVSSLVRPYSYDIVSDDGEILSELNMSDDKLDAFLKKLYLFGDVPYLRKEDLQKFFKRFRYYVKKSSKSKVTYFACGEYGPVHFRPHFHILLFFDDDAILQVCEQAVLQAWPFGRIDVQIAKGSCSQYVAGYVNSTCTLPEVYKASAIRPFNVHSQRLGWKLLQSSREEIYASTTDDIIKKGLVINGTYREINLWRSYTSYYFPKCKGYANKSTLERLTTYRIYDKARKAFPGANTALDLAKEIALNCYYFGSCPKNTFYVGELDTFEVIQYFKTGCCGINDVESDHFQRYIMNIYNELLLSKHFIMFCCYGRTDIQSSRQMLKKIDDFYARLDYLHLIDFFETQNEFYLSNLYGSDDLMTDKFGNQYFPYFYNNVDVPLSDYCATPVYKLMSKEVSKLYEDRIKHKVLNDMNKIFLQED